MSENNYLDVIKLNVNTSNFKIYNTHLAGFSIKNTKELYGNH
jgi:hypothetical protein